MLSALTVWLALQTAHCIWSLGARRCSRNVRVLVVKAPSFWPAMRTVEPVVAVHLNQHSTVKSPLPSVKSLLSGHDHEAPPANSPLDPPNLLSLVSSLAVPATVNTFEFCMPLPNSSLTSTVEVLGPLKCSRSLVKLSLPLTARALQRATPTDNRTSSSEPSQGLALSSPSEPMPSGPLRSLTVGDNSVRF